MNEDSPPLNAGQDGPLMDFLLAVAGAWKPLVVVPVVTGILVGAGMHFGRSTNPVEVYRSQATIYSESVGDSELELSAVMTRADSSEKSGQREVGNPADLAIRITPLGNSLYQVTLDQPTPAMAQVSLKAAIERARSWLAERDRKHFAETEEVLKAMNAGLVRQQSLYDLGLRLLSGDSAPADTGDSDVLPQWQDVIKLAGRIEQRQADITRIEGNLSAFRAAEVLEEPTPSAALLNPQISNSRLGILAALVAGIVLLLAIVIKHRFQRLFQEPAMRARLQRVLSEL